MAEKFFQNHFQRFETKYIISKETLLNLLLEFEGYLVEDERAYSTINNFYYDTPSYQLIRESLENPCFDEKVRLRTYQEHPTEDSQVYADHTHAIGQQHHALPGGARRQEVEVSV